MVGVSQWPALVQTEDWGGRPGIAELTPALWVTKVHASGR